MKKIAVIMSVYKNDELLHLQECVKSILSQTYSDFDLHIQLDGKISEACENYLDSLTDKRILKYSREENKGLACSLNELLDEVLQQDYCYIARMDADDICFPYRFQRQIEYMETHSQVDICGGYIDEMDEEGKSIGIIEYPLEHTKMKVFFGWRNPLAHVTVFFRKTYFEKAGYYPTDTNKDEDTMFWLKGFLSGCIFANINEPLVRVRVNNNFYHRRNGFNKSWGDLKNRCKIVYSLGLSPINYFLALGRFLFFILPLPWLTKLAYRYLR